MKKNLLTALAAGVIISGSATAQTTMYGITNANAIFTMSNPNTPSSITGPYSITGVASGQAIVAIDSRPGTGGLYALGYDSIMHQAELYTLMQSGTTYTATAVSGTLASMDLGPTNNVAFDFVSNSDNQIRVIGRNGNHYMMGADGTLMATGTGALGFASGDVLSGSSSALAAIAYTNSFYGSDATQQVGYDAANNVLVSFDAGSYANGFNNASNNMHSIGAGIGAVLLATGSFGMDAWYDTATHSNTIFMTGSSLLAGAHLYKYNMATGTAGVMSDVGAIGDGTLSVRDIAFATSRDSTSVVTGRMMTGLSLNMRNLIYFDAARPENIRKVVRLSGMTAGQAMIGIDYSGNGRLYGLGYNSGAHTYQLYTIDSATGVTTAVNASPIALNLGTDDGSGNRINAGFRFIASASDRIRVIGNNGTTNVQLNAATGDIAATNSPMQYVTGDAHVGATANLTSFAYTGFPNDTATQMFGFDANTGAMVMFSNTNDNAGFGDGTSGFLTTSIDLNSTLNLLLHNNTYNNAHMNIMYNQATNSNMGYMVANYLGDSSAQQNYSVMYDLTSMLTAYHKGTAGGPVSAGKVGYGVPVKDVTATRYYTAPAVTAVATVGSGANDLFVYPNPAISNARIMLPVASEGRVTVRVVDMNGAVVRTYGYEPRSYQLDVDVSTLPAGIYSVRVSGKGIGEHNLKVIKG